MSSIRQCGNHGDQRTAKFVYEHRKEARWRDADTMATRSLSGMGRNVLDTFAMCHVTSGCNEADSAAASAELKKCQKYSDIISGVDFVPVAIETSGVWGKQALELVKEIGRRVAAITYDNRSASFLRQRLSVAIQRGNAYCVLGTFPKSHVVDEL